MSKILTFLCLLSFQIASAQKFDFYAQAGLVASQIDGDHMAGYDKMGGTTGVGVHRTFNEKWGALMEIGYIQKGKGSYTSKGANYEIRLNYIQLPLVATYQIAELFQIESGCSFGFLLSYQFFEDGENNNKHRPYTPKNLDINWLLGASYKITEEWRLNLRFAYSIVPMGNLLDEDTYRTNFWRKNGGQYNHSLCLSVQYWF